MKNMMKYFKELFQHVDIDNQETIGPLIAEYNLRVINLLVEIQIMVSDSTVMIWKL